MLAPSLVAAPAELAVSLAEAKAHLRVSHTDHDALIGGQLAAAITRLDGYSGVLARCLVSQTWGQSFAAWPPNRRLRLALAPVADNGVAALTYVDVAGAGQTVAVDWYRLLRDESGPFVRLNSDFALPALAADRDDAVTVSYIAGYGAPAAVPAPLKAAILLQVEMLYRPLDAAKLDQLQRTIDNLIAPYRRVGV